jgi:hypothetical protein
MALGFLAPRVVDENAAHGFGGGEEEVSTVLPLRFRIAAQSQPRLVDQRGGLQGLAGRLARHFLRRQYAQLLIDQGQEAACGFRLAPFALLQ